MATSSINTMNIYNIKPKPVLTTATLLRHCHIFGKVDFILSVNCNNEKKLNVTLSFSLAKATFI